MGENNKKLLIDLPSVGSDKIDPDPGKVAQAFSRIGYRLEEALADLIDNSIDASANHILVRFLRDRHSLKRIVIADDGHGMKEKTLKEAMKFGSDIAHKESDLGKYGMGMKTASFSQCRSFSVISRYGGRINGRRWTMDSINNNWACEKLDETACARLLDSSWYILDLRVHGTLLVWDDLDTIKPSKDGIDEVLTRIFKSTSVHTGLVYHRFLESKRVKIFFDAVNIESGDIGPPREVSPLDPFFYPSTGKDGYPKTYEVQMNGLPSLNLEAHVWPPKSHDPGYKLGGGNVANRQGFYFYRNDRVVQAGGWNGWRESQAEPHSSLARVRCELPPQYDSVFRLKVQKSGLEVPPEFLNLLGSTKKGKNSTLGNFVQDAIEVYRKHRPKSVKGIPYILGDGVPKGLHMKSWKYLSGGSRQYRKVDFVWEKLERNRFFELDLNDFRVILNREYRHDILSGAPASGADAPLIKTLIFLLLRNEFDHQFLSRKDKGIFEEINKILLAALRYQK